MRTPQQWWDEVKVDQAKLIDWLKNQYHGEMMAAGRIQTLFLDDLIKLTPEQTSTILRIAKEEFTHARWIKKLLNARGITAEVLIKEERYWNKVLPEGQASVEELAAIAHLAETMRLNRIQVIAEDKTAPHDIRKVFKKILPMELNHAKWFAEMTTEACVDAARDNHNLGLNALGLVI
jgi:rubrerythrin